MFSTFWCIIWYLTKKKSLTGWFSSVKAIFNTDSYGKIPAADKKKTFKKQEKKENI